MRWTMLVALTAALIMIAVGCAVGQTGGSGEPAKTTPPETKAPEVKATETKAPETQAKAGANPMVLIETNLGNIKVELFKDKAPISVENFLSYIKEGYYDSTIVHRVSTKQAGEKFVIQVGGITVDMRQKPQKPGIKNEATNGLSNLRGTLSMARTSDINSGSSHFFINLSDNKFLDHTGNDPKTFGYAVFGKVVEGMDVVDKIGQSAVGSSGGYQDVPTKPVIISKVKVVMASSKATSQQKAEPKQATEPETQNKPGETKPEDKGTQEPESKTTK